MAWTSPKTWNVREKLTAALMNMHLRDNLSYLKSVLEGTSTDKIPGNAIAVAPTLYQALVRNDGNPAVGTSFVVGGYQNLGAGNDNRLNVGLYRTTTGTSWADTSWKLEQNIDNGAAIPAGLYIGNIGGVGRIRMEAADIYVGGKLIGPSFFSYGPVYYNASTSATIPHGLGAQPRFVAGYSDYLAAGTIRPMQGDSRADDPYISQADAANIYIATTSGGGASIVIFAML